MDEKEEEIEEKEPSFSPSLLKDEDELDEVEVPATDEWGDDDEDEEEDEEKLAEEAGFNLYNGEDKSY